MRVSVSRLANDAGRTTGEFVWLLSLPCGLVWSPADDTAGLAVVVLPRRGRELAVALLHTTLPRPSVMKGGSVSCTAAVGTVSGVARFAASFVEGGGDVPADGSESCG